MNIIRESVKIGDKVVTLETGRIAKQAHGSVLVTCGDTVLLVTVCGAKEARPGTNFMPLTVDYIEKTYAAGKIPGGFFKREGKLRDSEVLTSRLIDRPCRPLFPDNYFKEVQVIATVHSADDENPSDVLAMTGASAALHLSPIPWAGPIAGVRVGRVDGRFVANPTYQELAVSDMDIVIAASRDAIMMVEGECDEISEADMQAALEFGHQAVQDTITLIEKMREFAGAEKWPHEAPATDENLIRRVRDVALAGVREACNVTEKHARYQKFADVKKATVEALAAEFPEREAEIKEAFSNLQYETMRAQVLDDRRRVDGRDLKTVRPISIEVGFLPRTHGSALFTRGETQAIVTATLGTRQDEQRIDGLIEEYWKSFLLHYNFPPYSVGETRPMRGPGRREVGHGNLAERALKKMMPSREEFPYTVRVVSEITESNGSSSMATVCGGSLALMDAGVPLKKPVAGVAMGLIKEGEKYAVLTDILGDEDHLGDMDFKVCGTDKGITAIQMDIKVEGLSASILQEALEQAREGRLHILSKMNEILDAPRPELNRYAPRITTIKVKPDQIRLVIGPGGKMIKAIVDQTGVKIDVADDGTVSIASADAESVQKAIAIVESLTTEPEIGQKYKGIVRRVERYGAFLEIAPGTDGLLHITDMSWDFVDKVDDIMKLGDEIEVIVSDIDRDGRIRLNRKALLEKPEGYVEREPSPRNGRDKGERRSRDDRGRDKGERREGRERDEKRGEDKRSRERDEEKPRRDEEKPRRDEKRGRDEDRPARSAEAERPRRRDEEEERPRRPRDEDEDRPRRRDEDERSKRARGEERSARTLEDERPRRSRDEDERPRRARDEDERPRRARDEDERPRRARDEDERPRRTRDEDERPRRARDEDERPRRARDEDEPPRRSRDELDRPRRARDEDERPRRVRDEDDRPRRVRDEDELPRRSRDELDRPRRARDEDERPRRVRDEDDRPRRARDEDERPRRVRDEDERPRRALDEDEAPRRVRDELDRPRRAREDDRGARLEDDRPSRRRRSRRPLRPFSDDE